jgi:hypothetical protein
VSLLLSVRLSICPIKGDLFKSQNFLNCVWVGPFFNSVWVWTQDLALAKQVLYHLSHFPSCEMESFWSSGWPGTFYLLPQSPEWYY